MQKHCTPEFVFKKVSTWPVFYTYLLAFILFIPAFVSFITGWYAYLGYGAKSMILLLTVILVSVVLNGFSKTVIIYFDRKAMYVGDQSRNFKRILNRNIIGFYSYDYERFAKSYVSVKFIFKNGKTLILQDAGFAERKDPGKAQMLKQFLVAAKRRLNFTFTQKSRWRAFFLLSAYWYAKEESTKTTPSNLQQQ